jgi:4-amino-4-deoxy-L-arabinose transferase-like glycosyltransferase
MNFIKNHFCLGLVIFLFLVTRLYKIAEIPASVYWDEASIGYNAYSIATDLKDEWGDTLPLHFRAFGEFKLPVYIYSVAILTKLFGMNEFTLRFPAVMFSLGAVIFTYLLVVRITKSSKIGLMSSFLLTISPWLFIFSRTGYEATAGLFFFLAFVYFLIFNDNKKLHIALSLSFAILSFYSYNSFRILIPIFFSIWAIKSKKIVFSIVFLLVFCISLIPVIRLYKFDSGAARLTTVGIHEPQTFIKNYFSHFTYDFLFKNGDVNDRSQVPGWGQTYFVGLPFFAIGLLWILRSKIKFSWVFLIFLLIGAIPSAITRESPHALRSILLAPTFSILSALGIFRLLEKYNIKKYSNIFLVSLILIYLIFFGKYFFDFITTYNSKTSSAWQYEYKEIFAKQTSGIVTDKYAQPYIFALYYLKYPPEKFRQTVKYNPVDKWGFSTVKSFGNFEFK